MTARQVDLLLDRCSDMQAQRDRAIVQRAAFEGELWFVECQMKQLVSLLPRMIAATPADGVARDTHVEQINEWLAEPRHGAPDFTLLAGAAGRTGPNEGTGEKGEAT